MTEEEFKKAINKVIAVAIIALLVMVILAIIIFNNFGKSTTVFKSEEQKEDFKNAVENIENEDINVEDIIELEDKDEILENIQDENVIANEVAQ